MLCRFSAASIPARLWPPLLESALPQLGDSRGVADDFDVGDAMEQPDTCPLLRPLQCRRKGCRFFDPLAPAAIGLRQPDKVGVLQSRRAQSLGIFALLVHSDRAVGAIVHQDD